jgi:hypothetical protein
VVVQKKLKKIRLSPVLMTVVAIAAPLSLSLPATGTTKLTPEEVKCDRFPKNQ